MRCYKDEYKDKGKDKYKYIAASFMRASKARRGIAESPIPAVPRLALPCFKLLHVNPGPRGETL